MQKTQNSNDLKLKKVEKYSSKLRNTYANACYLLTQLKLGQFSKLEAQSQLEYVRKLDWDFIRTANLSSKDFNEDLIGIILGNITQKVPLFNAINGQSTGLWGKQMYERPKPKAGVSTEKQYREAKWLAREKNYEKVIDLIFDMIKTSYEKVGRLGIFLKYGTWKTLCYTLRTLLKPSIGHPLKTIHLDKIKRTDFLPFKYDRGYEVVLMNLDQVHNGHQVYSYKKSALDLDFGDNKIFYVYGDNSICTKTILKKTRMELDEYEDEYIYFEGEDDVNDNDDDEEFGYNPELLQTNRRRMNQYYGHLLDETEDNQDGKGDKDNNDNHYKLKKYSILSYKTRSSLKLTKTDKYDKMDNRVSTDMLRSGAAIIRKLRHPPMEFVDIPQRVAKLAFIRLPIYYMYVPKRFTGSNFCKKFLEFRYKRFFFAMQMRWNGLQDDTDNDYDCLYVKRTKKVVFRGNNFRNSHLQTDRMLALERVHSNGRVVNFEDPSQRDPYYSRVFKLVNPFLKRTYKTFYLNLENNKIPADAVKPYHYCLIDYTTRTKSVAKYDQMTMLTKSKPSIKTELNLSESGDSMHQDRIRFNFRKIMKKGQPSRFEPLRFDSRFREERKNADECSNDLITYWDLQYDLFKSSFEYDPDSGLSISYLAQEEISHVNYYGNEEFYHNKPRFLKVNKDKESGTYFLRVIKDGLKKIYRFPVKEGSLIAVSKVFRKVYILNQLYDKIELRVVTFEAIISCINQDTRMGNLSD